MQADPNRAPSSHDPVETFNKTNQWGVAALMAAILLIFTQLAGAQAAPVTLGQTAIEGSLTGVGYVEVTASPASPNFSPSDTVGYLNVFSNLHDRAKFEWVIQNQPVPLSPDGGDFGYESPALFSAAFDLHGLSLVGSYQVCANFTPTMVPSARTYAGTGCSMLIAATYDIGSLVDGAIAGELDGGPLRGYPVGSGMTFTWTPSPGTPPDGVIESVRKDIPGIKQGNMECAPVSAAQSYEWLDKRGKLGDAKLPPENALINMLKEAMKWDLGIAPGDFVPGVEKVTTGLKLPLTTESGGNMDGTGTFDFIKAQFEAGQDIEMRLEPRGWASGHWVTIAGWHDDGKKRMLFFKDPLTGGESVESYELDGTTLKDYKYAEPATRERPETKISFAVAQSPKK